MSWSRWKETRWKESIKASLISQHEEQSRSFMIWWRSDEEHVHEPTTLCVLHMCQVQVVHEKGPLNRSQWWKMLTKERKRPIRLMEYKTLHKSQCVNRFLVVEHKGNHPVNDQWWNVNCWVQSFLPRMKVGPRWMIGIQYHVILRKIEGMADMQSQEF